MPKVLVSGLAEITPEQLALLRTPDTDDDQAVVDDLSRRLPELAGITVLDVVED